MIHACLITFYAKEDERRNEIYRKCRVNKAYFWAMWDYYGIIEWLNFLSQFSLETDFGFVGSNINFVSQASVGI